MQNAGFSGSSLFLEGVKKAMLNKCTFKNNYAEVGGSLFVNEGSVLDFKSCLFT